MRNALVLLPLMLVASCASLESRLTCAAGEEPMRTAQLFFGQNIGGKPGVSDADFRKFTDEVLTPRFPEGLTVLDGGGQWTGAENKLIREAAKIVVLVLPATHGENRRKLGEVRQAYVERFHQDSVMMISQRACVSF
ncbi:DUF3574 domain-containing protein [Phenylobacterium sp.]|uniref:DUF3574 domain-containing protein n=1 Tax=Phenylobacterium sp. TaxID=1871053 RepID=UPI002724AFE0|nr:DUF3574 domain-containing protein [Phenylobacterium sp.]MDO8799592.1 DUF3574 domain-containing protein [Phenylobacterium sp.]